MTWLLEIAVGGKVEQVSVGHPVCRIGGSPPAELQVPGLPPHAATLRRQGDRPWVYARESAEVFLGGTRLPMGSGAEWFPEVELRLAPSVTVRMVRSDRPRSAPAARATASGPSSPTARRPDDSEAAAEPSRAAGETGSAEHASPPSSRRGQWSLIAVACLAVLFWPSHKSRGPTFGPELPGILRELAIREFQPGGNRHGLVRHSLQKAEISLKQGRMDLAAASLRSARLASSATGDPLLARAKALAERRLNEIPSN